MNNLPRYKFSREYEYFDYREETYRKTSFSIIKHTTYSKTEDAIDVANRLERLKEDRFEHDGKIKVPYFEFKVEDNVLIYQSEYIKGVAPTNNDMKHVYEKLVYRPGAYTFLDYTPQNFIVDRWGIHIVDLDSYGSHDFEERMKRWNETIKKYNIHI